MCKKHQSISPTNKNELKIDHSTNVKPKTRKLEEILGEGLSDLRIDKDFLDMT